MAMIQIMADLSSEKTEARRHRTVIFKVIKERKINAEFYLDIH